MADKMVKIDVTLVKVPGKPPVVFYADEYGRAVDIVDKKFVPVSVKKFFRKYKLA